MSRIEDRIAQELICGVCFEKYTVPKVLPCQHTFCLKCLNGSVAKKKIKCPTCRKGFSIPHGGVDGFPTNFLINNLLLVLDKQETENKENNFNCGFCEEQVAVSKCYNCNHFLCENHVKLHKKDKVLATHNLISIEDFRKDALHDSPSPSLESRPNGISVAIENERNQLYTKAKSQINEFQKVIENIKKTRTSIIWHTHKIDSEIEKEFDVIKKEIYKRKKELQEQLNTISNAKQKALDLQQRELEMIANELQQSCEQLRVSIQSEQVVDLSELRAQIYRNEKVSSGLVENDNIGININKQPVIEAVQMLGLVKEQESVMGKKNSLLFPYSGIDYDGRGIVHWLGTNRGKDHWKNPHPSHVTVTASSNELNSIESLTSNKPQLFSTCNVVGSWIELELHGIKVRPSFYTLGHHHYFDADALCNWNFQASKDGVTWQTLRVHRQELVFQTKESHSWAIEDCKDYFSRFRILSTGPTVCGENYLRVYGLELYGEVKDVFNS